MAQSMFMLRVHLLRFPVSEAEFLRSDAFVSLTSAISRHGLLVTDTKVARNQLFDAKNRSESQTIVEKSDHSSQESPGEMKEAKIPSRSPENAPNCFTPRRQEEKARQNLKVRAVKLDASSFLDRSTHSHSSISQISLKTSYAQAYKKSKIRQKVQTVTRSVKA